MFDNYDLATLKTTWGVYAIVRIETGRQYIGGTGDSFFNRWKGHWYILEKGIHDNKALQWDWLFLGSNAFEFRILESFTGKGRSHREGKDSGSWARHREALMIVQSQNLYNAQMPAAPTLAGERAQHLSSRIWEAFYGSPPPLNPDHGWWKRIGRR